MLRLMRIIITNLINIIKMKQTFRRLLAFAAVLFVATAAFAQITT